MEKALQWWYKKKLAQLEFEANVIREQLLQESFAIRRDLELSSVESNLSSSSLCKKCIKQLEEFDFTLKELSDRLYPPYIKEGLPFALQYFIKQWQKRLPHCQFDLSLPQKWQSQASTESLIVLNILEDLLHIKEAKTLFNNLIFITLEQNTSNCGSNNQLKVVFQAEKPNDFTTNRDRQELQYLQQTFESLISGSCSNILTANSDKWLFEW